MTAVIVVANLKGGSGKTTNAGFLLHAFAATGRNVIGVDADPQQSLADWQAMAGWDIPVVPMASPTLHRQFWGVVDQRRWDLAVVDTPPLEDKAGIVESALRIATVVVVSMAPTAVELSRIDPVLRAVDSVGQLPVVVLLNRVIANASSTASVRTALTNIGVTVLEHHIGRRELYAQAHGTRIDSGDEFAAVANELIRGYKL